MHGMIYGLACLLTPKRNVYTSFQSLQLVLLSYMDIIVDTREQLPLFKNNCIKHHLIVGDYSTMNLRHSFAIERKTLQDLYGTITSGHVRFRHEHIRSLIHKIELVIYIEGTKKDFAAKNFPGGKHRNCSGATLIKIVTTISKNWPLEFVWCKSRNDCKQKIKMRLFIEEQKLLYEINRKSFKIHKQRSLSH